MKLVICTLFFLLISNSYAEIGIPLTEPLTVDECGETLDDIHDYSTICAELNSPHCNGGVAISSITNGINCLSDENSENFLNEWELDV
jgi:hypothetical protein